MKNKMCPVFIAMQKRIAIRKRMFRRARKNGASIKQAKECAKRAWFWVDDDGSFLPLFNAPRCDDHPLWDDVELDENERGEDSIQRDERRAGA